uniref:Niban 1/2/3 domain-containing protein n=1 Tax=Oryzias sinensis TaxID=183150 RepID=A0A8C7YWJ9_9TELE
MGASSSGMLDEAKISHIKGLVDAAFKSFSGFYRQQYAVAYLGHLHQEMEPKKEGRGLLLKTRPHYDPEEVLYQGSVRFSCWDEQGKKCKERYILLRRIYKVEIHDNVEVFKRGSPPKEVIQPAGARVFTTEEESWAQLEKTCAGILNGVKEDSSSVVSSPDTFAVYLHLPYKGYTCFLFQQEGERDHFLSVLKTCIRHQNLDSWHRTSHEGQAFARAFRLYQQDKGCYESWEKLLGTEEQVSKTNHFQLFDFWLLRNEPHCQCIVCLQVLASQVMEEVLPWLQSQLNSKLKGKKIERIRQWLATVQAAYMLVLDQLTAGLEVLKKECQETASASQTLIRSNLDQIMSSRSFLEEKVKACILEEAKKVCSESVAPYLSSILEALSENIGSGILAMQETLHTQMDSNFSLTNGGTEETKQISSSLHSISLEQSYRKVESLAEILEDLKGRFGLSSAQRLVHSAHLEMEQLLDSAVYTLEQFLQSSTRLQATLVPVKMDRAKERVFKQLDYDSRVVQRRLYEEALLEITLPALTRRMDSSWKTELQQFEQYIFSDYSSFIVVQNIYDDVLRNLLSKETETVVQEAASKKSNNLLLDTSDLAISQYSLLGQTVFDSPTMDTRDSISSELGGDQKQTPMEGGVELAVVCSQSDADLEVNTKSESSTCPLPEQSAVQSPLIVVTQQWDDGGSEDVSGKIESETIPALDETSTCDGPVTCDTQDPPADLGSNISESADTSALDSPQPTDVQAGSSQSELPEMPEDPATPELLNSDQVSEEASAIQTPSPSHTSGTDSPTKVSLGSLSEAIAPSSIESEIQQVQQTTDRAVYLTGQIKDNWELEKEKEEKQKGEEEKEVNETVIERKEVEMEGQVEHVDLTGEEPAALTAELTMASNTEQKKIEEIQYEVTESEVKTDKENTAEDAVHVEEEVKEEKEASQSVQPEEPQLESPEELPLDSVAIIRELVTEITEVETIITPTVPAGEESDVTTSIPASDSDQL